MTIEQDGRKKNGGARAGAGKPPSLKAKRPPMTQLQLTAEERQIAAALGEGKIVTGIRRALAFSAQQAGITAKPSKS